MVAKAPLPWQPSYIITHTHEHVLSSPPYYPKKIWTDIFQNKKVIIIYVKTIFFIIILPRGPVLKELR